MVLHDKQNPNHADLYGNDRHGEGRPAPLDKRTAYKTVNSPTKKKGGGGGFTWGGNSDPSRGQVDEEEATFARKSPEQGLTEIRDARKDAADDSDEKEPKPLARKPSNPGNAPQDWPALSVHNANAVDIEKNDPKTNGELHDWRTNVYLDQDLGYF